MPFRFFPLVLTGIALSLCSIVSADDADIRNEIKKLQNSVSKLNERIASLEASISKPRESADFAWNGLGTRLAPCDPGVIESLNTTNRTRYRGAVSVSEVRPGSPADVAGIEVGDLLLGIARWQTTDLDDIRRIGSKQNKLASQGKTKFYVVRNTQTLFGYIDIAQLP